MRKILLLISMLLVVSCSKQAVKGIALKAISVKQSKFLKVKSIKKDIILSRSRNYLVHLKVVGVDSYNKDLQINYCVCIRKDEKLRNMFATRVDECPSHKLEKYKRLCNYPNDIDRDIAHKLGIILEKNLYEFSLKGDLKEIDKVLKSTEIDINRLYQSGNFNYYSIFHGAVKNAHMHIIDYLLQRKANINVSDHQDNTPLNIENIDLKVAMKLVQSGANLDVINIHNETPIFRAIREGRKLLVMLYAEGGAGLKLKNEYDENIVNILFSSKINNKMNENDFYEILDYFFKAKVDLNNRSTHFLQSNDYPIVLAVRAKDLVLVEKLISYKANLDLKSNQEFTPLMIALVRDYYEIAKFLIDSGADVNMSGKQGMNPLGLGLKDLDMVKYLLVKGFALTEWNVDEFISSAKKINSLSVVKFLKVKKQEMGEKSREAERVRQEKIQKRQDDLENNQQVNNK